MEAYKPYLDYITSGQVAETAYILSRDGAICATTLPIKQMPSYNFSLEDEKDPNIKHNVVVDQRLNLIEALQNKGVCKNKAGIRLYNQKYYTTHFDQKPNGFVASFYLKKTQGGACICLTRNFILIGTFNSTLKMANNVPQNPGQLNKRVESLAQNMFAQGS